tara:strand:- start:8996 stop:10066 length:1071 start_codon:yes stop_codon:yes gene_type:complete
MNKQELKHILKGKQGYLKSGSRRLSKVFGVSRDIAIAAVSEVKEEIKIKSFHVDLGKSDFTNSATALSKQEALKFAANALIDKGRIEEAIDLLTRVEKETDKPSYSTSKFADGNYVVLGCTHLPFHNKKMWTATCKLISEMENLKGIILAGDNLDMHSISRHSKGKIRLPGYTLAREYKEANIALDELDAAIGNRKIVKEYFYGNHEDWYNQWGKDVDNSYLGRAGAKSPYEACFKKRGYNTQFNWKVANVKLGDLEIIHGEWCNKHAAHKHAAELHRNIAFFHTHRMGTYFESNIAGYNCGWGGDKDSPVFSYMSKSQKENWRNGILTVTLKEGISYPTILDFKNDHFSFNNKLY